MRLKFEVENLENKEIKKFCKIQDIINEYTILNLQYHEIQELTKTNGKERKNRDRMKYILTKIKINKLLN